MEVTKIQNDYISSIKLSRPFENKILDKDYIYNKYVCVRPGCKYLFPKTYSQTNVHEKIIINNYGHSGIGWTSVWGTVNKALKIFDVVNKSFSKDEKITILGAGIVGCATALSLIDKGHYNIEIISEKFEDTTSHLSGAFFGVFLGSFSFECHKEKQAFEEVITETYLKWEKIHESRLFGINKGISKIDIYMGAEQKNGPIDSNNNELLGILIDKGLIKKSQLVNLCINSKVSHKMYKNQTYYFNTNILLEEMYSILNNKNVKFTRRKVESLDDKCLNNIVFNCTGLGNRELVKDKDIDSIAGHVVYLKNQEIKDTNYLIISDYIIPYKSDDNPITGLFYYMPKHYNEITGLLGGTYIKGYEGGNNDIDKHSFELILKMANHFFGLDLIFDETESLKSKF